MRSPPCRPAQFFTLNFILSNPKQTGPAPQNVFSLNESSVSGLDPGLGGACESRFSTTVSFSTSQFSESSSTS